MNFFLPSLGLIILCFLPILAATWAGVRVGRRIKSELRPQHEHLGTIQGALLGMLGLLLGFALSGAISRYVDRQDALAREANAIDTAYGRMDLLPNAAAIKAILRDYARARLDLFEDGTDRGEPRLEAALDGLYDNALAAVLEGTRQAPQFANLAITGIEAVNDRLSERNALAHRHLPVGFVMVMLGCSCLAMATIGYGVGLADKRSMGATYALSVMVGVTLLMTFDFDLPRRGIIRLNPAPLRDVADKLAHSK